MLLLLLQIQVHAIASDDEDSDDNDGSSIGPSDWGWDRRLKNVMLARYLANASLAMKVADFISVESQGSGANHAGGSSSSSSSQRQWW